MVKFRVARLEPCLAGGPGTVLRTLLGYDFRLKFGNSVEPLEWIKV
jgi:hypothetical protein